MVGLPVLLFSFSIDYSVCALLKNLRKKKRKKGVSCQYGFQYSNLSMQPPNEFTCHQLRPYDLKSVSASDQTFNSMLIAHIFFIPSPYQHQLAVSLLPMCINIQLFLYFYELMTDDWNILTCNNLYDFTHTERHRSGRVMSSSLTNYKVPSSVILCGIFYYNPKTTKAL